MARDSLRTLAAYEDEEAKRQGSDQTQEAQPSSSKKTLWSAVTAAFRVPPTFVWRWNAKLEARRKRKRRLIKVLKWLTPVALCVAGYFVFMIPAVKNETTRALDAADRAAEPYFERLRHQIAVKPEETSDPTPATTAPPAPVPAARTGSEPEAFEALDEEGEVRGRRKKGRKGRANPRGSRAGKRTGRAEKNERGGGGGRGRPLTSQQIVAGVRKQLSSLGPCVNRARRAQEIAPGRYNFVLNWVIQPNGVVSKPKLSGPAGILLTSLPACFAAQMGGWRFPRAPEPTKVNNFPFPATVP